MENFAEKVTNRVAAGIPASEKEKIALTFVIQMLLINIPKIVSFLLLAWITHSLFATVVTYISFLALRIFITGYHALSDAQCFVLTMITFWLVPWLFTLTSLPLPLIITVAVTLFTGFVIVKYGAQGTKINPIAPSQQKKRKVNAIITLSLLTVISLLPQFTSAALFIVLGILTAATRILPITEKIFIRMGKLK